MVVSTPGCSFGRLTSLCIPAEVKLVEKTLAAIRVRRRHRGGRPRQKPERMIMDLAATMRWNCADNFVDWHRTDRPAS